MEKMSYEEILDLMGKIYEAMDISRNKQVQIDDKDNKLHEETRVLMVEEGKKEIESLKQQKEEFDEMTVNSLVTAKKQILTIREETERQYQEMLIKTLEKQHEIERKLQSMRAGELSDEKLKWAENSAEKARENVNTEMKEFQEKYFEQRVNLDQYEKDINEFAFDIGMEDRLEAIEISTPSNPTPTPSNPTPTPSNPTPTPSRPTPTPSNPTPTPSNPTPTPSNPTPTPSRPTPTPSNPTPTPSNPTPTPSNPTPTPSRPTPSALPKSRIVKIELGKEPYITYLNDKGKKTNLYLTFSQVKKCMELKNDSKLKLLGQIDKEMAKQLSLDEQASLQVPHMDPVVIALLRKVKDVKSIDENEVRKILQYYKEAIVDDKPEAQEKMKKILTYNRKNMDYVKLSNMFSKMVNKKTFDKIKNYCMYAEKATNIKLDTPGIIAKLLFKNRPLELNGKVYESRLGESEKEGKTSEKIAIKRIKRDISKDATKKMKAEVEKYPDKFMKFQDNMQIDSKTKEKLEDITKKYQQGRQEPIISQTYKTSEEMSKKMGEDYFEASSRSYKSTFDIEKAKKEVDEREEEI